MFWLTCRATVSCLQLPLLELAPTGTGSHHSMHKQVPSTWKLIQRVQQGAAAHNHWATCTCRTAPLRKSAELAGYCSAHTQGYSTWISKARSKCTSGTPTTVDSQHNRKLMHTHVYTRVPHLEHVPSGQAARKALQSP